MNYGKFKNFKELYDDIEMGLDIEFLIGKVTYNISWENDNCVFISVCPDGETKYYSSTQELLDNYKIDGVAIKDLWRDINIYHIG